MSKEEQQRNKEMKVLREKGKTLQEIADIYGVSRERVRQIIGNTGRIYAMDENATTLLVGTTGEKIVSNKLSQLGIKHALTKPNSPFDILLDNGIRVEVKSAIKTIAKSPRSHTYRFGVRKHEKGDYCEFFIFYIYKTGNFFVVPNSEIRNVGSIFITDPKPAWSLQKWASYKDRFDLLKS